MTTGTGGYGGASMAIPLLLFAVCFPKIVLVLIGMGVAGLLAAALIWLVFGADA